MVEFASSRVLEKFRDLGFASLGVLGTVFRGLGGLGLEGGA